jgi:hypothetical protein
LCFWLSAQAGVRVGVRSLPAVEDLRVCLAHTGRQRGLVDAFRGQLRQRLLLPGAATTDILTHYIATIKVTPVATRTVCRL